MWLEEEQKNVQFSRREQSRLYKGLEPLNTVQNLSQI